MVGVEQDQTKPRIEMAEALVAALIDERDKALELGAEDVAYMLEIAILEVGNFIAKIRYDEGRSTKVF